MGQYCICVTLLSGKWSNGKWIGPPRAHLRKKFTAWSEHLCQGIRLDNDLKRIEDIVIQEDGGHQNKFIFAARSEYDTTPGRVWQKLLKRFRKMFRNTFYTLVSSVV